MIEIISENIYWVWICNKEAYSYWKGYHMSRKVKMFSLCIHISMLKLWLRLTTVIGECICNLCCFHILHFADELSSNLKMSQRCPVLFWILSSIYTPLYNLVLLGLMKFCEILNMLQLIADFPCILCYMNMLYLIRIPYIKFIEGIQNKNIKNISIF